jgi:hypothetical protein
VNHKLLACGVIAGPLFLAVSLAQASTRHGYDLNHHPISLLSLGDLGWVQIANFVGCGALLVACAVGMRRALYPGRGSTWGPLLIGVNGLGLIVAGVFVTDPGAGFPPGAPAGPPEHITWHGILHEVGFGLATLGWLAACFVLLRRFTATGERGWVAACIAAPVANVVVSAWPDLNTLPVRLVIGSAISFGFVAAVAVRLAPEVRNRSADPAVVHPPRCATGSLPSAVPSRPGADQPSAAPS